MKKADAAVEKVFMSNEALCWSCYTETPKESFFCQSCDIIQPASNIPVFKIFNMEESFIIDKDKLEQSYFLLQQKLHPDRFATKTAKEKMFASQQSMAVNDAYNILKNPLERADYLITLMGGNSYKKEDRTVPSTLLMNVMIQRETLSQAKDNEQLQMLLKQSQNKQHQIIEKIKTGFENKDIKNLEISLLALQYEQKFMQEVKQKIK